MKAIWNGKIIDIVKFKGVSVVIRSNKKILNVRRDTLIPLNNADKIEEKIFVWYKKQKAYLMKMYQTMALIRLKPVNHKMVECKVPIKELSVYYIKKRSYNLWLKKAMELTFNIHKDLILKVFNEKEKMKLPKTIIKLGKRTYCRYGSCTYFDNEITINNWTYLHPEEFFNKNGVRICKTILHEILHLKYHNHSNGRFHHIMNQYRENEILEKINELYI